MMNLHDMIGKHKDFPKKKNIQVKAITLEFMNKGYNQALTEVIEFLKRCEVSQDKIYDTLEDCWADYVEDADSNKISKLIATTNIIKVKE